MHPDVGREQAYFDRAKALRDRQGETGDDGFGSGAGASGQLGRLLAPFPHADPDGGVAFGRIDAEGDSFYIGRDAVWDDESEMVVVNWQAPIAAPFYTATPEAPGGLAARRVYQCEGNRILEIDELVFAQVAAAAAEGRPPTMSDALLDALDADRSGELRDIVATIQQAQYEVITQPLDQLLIVQGGPGTGKTQVGLHRVSWMLHNHADHLGPGDVLVVGPNPAFIRYIAAVLPGLGEQATVQQPISALGPQVRIARTDPPELRRLKGDRRMLRVIVNGLRCLQQVDAEPVEVAIGRRTVRLDGNRVAARARQLATRTHNEGHRELRSFLLEEVRNRLSSRGGPDLSIDPVARGEATESIDDYLADAWPLLTAQGYILDLFADPDLLADAAEGLLTDDEIDLLTIPEDARVGAWQWSLHDVPMLDAADVLLNGAPAAFEHIVVDEAQDLSPMQLEAIRRRSRAGSMTLLGDLAQGTSPWAHTSWEEVALHLRRRTVPTQIAELASSYRLPAEVHEVAMRLLPAIAPGLTPPDAVRSTGEGVIVTRSHDMAAATVEVVRALVGPALGKPGSAAARAESERTSETGGMVGIVVPARHRARVAAGLERAGLPWAPELRGGRAPIVLLSADAAKGLEFDNVVVVEPAQILAESERGLRSLFIAMTRCTQRLALVHREPLPAELGTIDAAPLPTKAVRRPAPAPVEAPAPPAAAVPASAPSVEGPTPAPVPADASPAALASVAAPVDAPTPAPEAAEAPPAAAATVTGPVDAPPAAPAPDPAPAEASIPTPAAPAPAPADAVALAPAAPGSVPVPAQDPVPSVSAPVPVPVAEVAPPVAGPATEAVAASSAGAAPLAPTSADAGRDVPTPPAPGFDVPEVPLRWARPSGSAPAPERSAVPPRSESVQRASPPAEPAAPASEPAAPGSPSPGEAGAQPDRLPDVGDMLRRISSGTPSAPADAAATPEAARPDDGPARDRNPAFDPLATMPMGMPALDTGSLPAAGGRSPLAESRPVVPRAPSHGPGSSGVPADASPAPAATQAPPDAGPAGPAGEAPGASTSVRAPWAQPRPVAPADPRSSRDVSDATGPPGPPGRPAEAHAPAYDAPPAWAAAAPGVPRADEPGARRSWEAPATSQETPTPRAGWAAAPTAVPAAGDSGPAPRASEPGAAGAAAAADDSGAVRPAWAAAPPAAAEAPTAGGRARAGADRPRADTTPGWAPPAPATRLGPGQPPVSEGARDAGSADRPLAAPAALHSGGVDRGGAGRDEVPRDRRPVVAAGTDRGERRPVIGGPAAGGIPRRPVTASGAQAAARGGDTAAAGGDARELGSNANGGDPPAGKRAESVRRRFGGRRYGDDRLAPGRDAGAGAGHDPLWASSPNRTIPPATAPSWLRGAGDTSTTRTGPDLPAPPAAGGGIPAGRAGWSPTGAGEAAEPPRPAGGRASGDVDWGKEALSQVESMQVGASPTDRTPAEDPAPAWTGAFPEVPATATDWRTSIPREFVARTPVGGPDPARRDAPNGRRQAVTDAAGPTAAYAGPGSAEPGPGSHRGEPYPAPRPGGAYAGADDLGDADPYAPTEATGRGPSGPGYADARPAGPYAGPGYADARPAGAYAGPGDAYAGRTAGDDDAGPRPGDAFAGSDAGGGHVAGPRPGDAYAGPGAIGGVYTGPGVTDQAEQAVQPGRGATPPATPVVPAGEMPDYGTPGRTERPGPADRPDQGDGATGFEAPERTGQANRIDRGQPLEGHDRTRMVERPGLDERPALPDRPSHSERIDRIDPAERAERAERAARIDRGARPAPVAGPAAGPGPDPARPAPSPATPGPAGPNPATQGPPVATSTAPRVNGLNGLHGGATTGTTGGELVLAEGAQGTSNALRPAEATGPWNELDREIARAVAATLAGKLARYVNPNLLPLVAEELGRTISPDTPRPGGEGGSTGGRPA